VGVRSKYIIADWGYYSAPLLQKTDPAFPQF